MIISNPVNIIFVDNKRILLVKRSAKDDECKNTWSLPGGGVEFKETFEEALHREIMEELNCGIKWLKYFRSYIFKLSDSHIARAVYFYGEADGTIDLDNTELSEHKWFLMDDPELSKLDFAFNQKQILSDFIHFWHNRK